MDFYLILKTLHVAAAVLWVGGGFLGFMLGLRARQGRDDAELVGFGAQLAWGADRLFVPAGIATLLTGLGTTFVGGLWGEPWVWLGLGGIFLTIAMGMTVLGPRLQRAARLAATGDMPRAAALVRQVIALARIDAAMLLAIVVIMVLKPGFADWPILAGLGAAVLLTGATSLPRALQSV